ncbi:uncharacterized protein LOC134814809 isoform X1 [Bolinopsis microptera]|uniref:uncharacterized protein LOC134814809 isoform X1 n=1 Tax=Bolinopsis microptera TaxID=2820187 RepID=UPI003079F4A9
MSKNSSIPIWSLGSKYSRVSIIQEILPSMKQRRSCANRSNKYLFPQSTGSLKTCVPFPRDKYSARRMPALPELCQKYFSKSEKGVKEEEETRGNKKIQIRLPVVRHTERHKAKQQVPEREVGGGSISYEDDWTFAKLNSSQGLRNQKAGAPTLKHYWNISGQERQRIISCPQHNLLMDTGASEEIDTRVWRVPARCLTATGSETNTSDILATTQRLIRTAESLQGSTNQLENATNQLENVTRDCEVPDTPLS